MEAELELRSSTNATTVAVTKIIGEREWKVGGGGGGKCLCIVFRLTGRSRVRGEEKKSVLGHPIARATNYCLLPDTF